VLGPGADVDTSHALDQGRDALRGVGDLDAAYHLLVEVLAAHLGSFAPDDANEMLTLCIDLQQARAATGPVDVAARGVAAANAQLPFHDEIQASFGHHDVSHVRAQVGGAAATAANSLGARAFAASDRVGFAGTPDLHTAAHEAAHVVQQRAGVSLKALDGGANDPHEQQADAVADAVVSGRRAEPLLDRIAPSGSQSSAVQRKTDGADAKASPAPKVDVAWAYLRANEDKFLAAIEGRLSRVSLSSDPRLAWVANGVAANFRQALMTALAGAELWNDKIRELVHPADPWNSIDLHRPLTEGTAGVVVDGREPRGPLEWSYLAGEALASDVQRALLASFARLVPRYFVQVDAKHPQPVEVADLVLSHPMDAVSAILLCNPHVVTPKVDKTKPHKNTAHTNKQPGDPRQFKDGVRLLQDWRWLGSTDPKLWNWLEVKDPRDATPEDVAATLWMDWHDGSKYAYGITASGPYFRIEPGWARRFSPDAQYAGLDDPHGDNALDLADSSVATDAAIAQAAGEKHLDKHGHALPPDLKALAQTLDRSARQIGRAKELLGDTKLWELVLPALKWVNRYAEGLMGVGDDLLANLTPVIEGQSEILFDAVGALTEVLQMAGNVKALTGSNNPVVDVLREFAIAIGESHLIDSARAHLNVAHKAKADLPLALLEISANDTATAASDFEASGHAGHGDDYANLTDIDRRRIADMRAKQAAGQNVDPGAVAYVAARVKERAVELRAKQLNAQLMDLGNLARDSQFGFFETMARIFDSDVRALPDQLFGMVTELQETVLALHAKHKQEQLPAAHSEDDQAIVLNQIAQATEQNLNDFVAKHDLKRRMSQALATIEKQERRTAVIQVITQIVILIGASVVGGVAANLVAGVVRGALIADAATASVGMVRAANAVGAVAGLTVEAGINATTQLAVQGGGNAKEAFVGNFLASGAIRIALMPLTRAAQTWGKAADAVENANVWQKAGRGAQMVVREGAVLTTSMITAAATDYVVQRIYHGGEPPTEKQAIDWAIQGGSLAIGSFVGRWVHGFESRAVQYAENKGQLLARARKMAALSADLSKSPTEEAALELLIQRQEALREEARVIDELARNPSAHPSLKPSTLEALRAGNVAESGQVRDAAFASVPLRLAGLTPDDASGTVWTGHRAQIESGIEQSRRAGIPVDVVSHDDASGRWQLSYNNERITVLETKMKSAVIMAGDDAELAKAAANIKPIPGYQDVVIHGTIDDFEVVVGNKRVSMDHRALATWLAKQGAGKSRIRLLSCETGKHPKGAAQHLANKLGVEVMAPTDLVHVFEDGSMVIGPTPERNTGGWETFKPQKAQRRFSSPKEQPPERAIDRFHKAKTSGSGGGHESVTLGDDAVAKPEVGPTSNLDDAMIRAEDFADKASSLAAPQLEATVRDVALISGISDVQVEAGLRILDPVFGENASNELKRVARMVSSEPESAEKLQNRAAFAALNERRNITQKQAVDVLRDPSLDIGARKAKLHQLLDGFEREIRASPKFDAKAFPFAEAHRQIDAMTAQYFDDMITVDAAGNLTQRQKPIGTLRELMANVEETNALMRRHQVPQEFVISISAPRDPSIPKEVKILSRKPADVPATALQTHAPVDPSSPSEQGTVVDIGVGTTDYAREVGGEQGKVVKTEYGPNYTDPAMMRRGLTWKNTGTRVDIDSVLVLGDTLQSLPMMFPERSVKRMFINNINAHYPPGGAEYRELALGLRKVMTSGGRVEVQWTRETEVTGGVESDRGHVTGEALRDALAGTAAGMPRRFDVNENAQPVTDYDYSVEAPRTESGVASKTPPANPVPQHRWIFTFGD
jgi:hypothetical protein